MSRLPNVRQRGRFLAVASRRRRKNAALLKLGVQCRLARSSLLPVNPALLAGT